MLERMTEITIHTGTQTFVLDDDATKQLLDHIDAAGGPNHDAAEAPVRAAIDGEGADDVRWSDDGKHGVVHAINTWLIAEGTQGMRDVMLELRDELMRDLRLPPFDEEVPYDAS
jgi:hypothetical protein